ncbi:MAG: hypothetical protein QM564_00495 [Bergeyella sp.]
MKSILTIVLFFSLPFFNKNLDDGYSLDFKCFKGYVFSSSKEITFIDSIEDRFTPSKQEIEQIEKLVSILIPQEKRANANFGKKCPKISKNLNNYNRQYVGYIDSDGNKIIWINFIWKKDCPDNWNKDIIIYTDGCSYFWQIKINLKENKFFDFYVNGVA